MHARLRIVMTVLGLLLLSCMVKAQSPATVLVVANKNNPNSLALANKYMAARKIPASNLLQLNTDANDNTDHCSLSYYNSNIATPIYAKIAQLPHIDYIVLCRNLPIIINDTNGSVDNALAAKTTTMSANPYYGSTLVFDSTKFKMYLVTRLDGWSWDDASKLIDNSVNAKLGAPFFIDQDPTIVKPDPNAFYNTDMAKAATLLQTRSITFSMDTTTSFVCPTYAVGGYASWGSNDRHFNATNFANLKFSPGALGTIAVSTSASNLRYPGGWQSQVAQLIHQGITGVDGNVAEPYSMALASPSLLFSNYVRGFNLAEAYYASYMCVGWKAVVVGDPLCNPYAH